MFLELSASRLDSDRKSSLCAVLATRNRDGENDFLCIVVALSCKAAYSCTCLQISHRDEFSQSDAVFAAKVTEVKQDLS